MKYIFMAMIMLGFSVAFASETTCSSSDSNLRYTQWSKEGGAHPMPGMIMREIVWEKDGQELGRVTSYYLEGEKEEGIIPTFTGNDVILDATHAKDKPTGSKTYASQVQIPDVKEKIFVICTHSYPTIPIP